MDHPAILTEGELFYLYIYMADDEWQSNTDMARIAENAIRDRRHTMNLVVHVREHAGWYLEYAMQDGQLVIVGTANDGAAVTTERRKFWERCGKMPTRMLTTVRRNELPKQVVVDTNEEE